MRAGAGRGDLWRLLDPGPDYWRSKADDPLARAFVEPVRAAGSGPLHALAGSGMQPDSLELSAQ